MDNLADNLHFNLTYPDFTQQTSLHVIHQQDTSFQGLPSTYSTFSLLPSSIPPNHLHQPSVDTTKETTRKQQLLPQACIQPQQQEQQQEPSLPSHEGIPLDNILSPSSSPPKKATPTRTRVTRPPNAFLLFNKEMRKRLKIDNPTWTVSEISKEIGDRWRTLSQEKKHLYVIHANKIKESQQALHPNAMYIRRSKAELTEAGHYQKVEKKKADSREQALSQVMTTASSPLPTTETTTLSSTTAMITTSSSTIINTSDTNSINGISSVLETNVLFGNNGSSAYTIPREESSYQPPAPQRKRPKRKQKKDRSPGAPKHPLSAYMWFLTEVRPETRNSYPGSTVGQISKLCANRWHAMAEKERLPWMTKATADKARYAREMRVYASQSNHTMGRGTRQKYRGSSPSLLLTIDSISQQQQQIDQQEEQDKQEHHHGLFYTPPSTSAEMVSPTSVDHRLHFGSSSSLLRNSLPGNVPMQDTMNPSELLQTNLTSALHENNDSY
ncbi:high mobility group box domain-containing protein [Chlamydoabsidia padenii]|nr:high mobility group box domain-containing protein [Chlamydoabsidia padenii]